MRKLFLCVLLLSVLSCSVQKRKYQNGFYVSWKHGKTNEQSANVKSKNKIEAPIAFEATPVQTELVSANAKNETAILKSLQQNYLQIPDSCDELVLKDGTETKVKVMEINSTEIKYKRCDMISGPLYVAKKSEIFMIKYANGLHEIFKNEEPTTPSSTTITKNNNSISALPTKQTYHALAIISLIFGILGIFPLTGIGSIIALVCGLIAKGQIKESPNKYKGEGMARAGVVLGIIVLSIIAFILLLTLIVILSL